MTPDRRDLGLLRLAGRYRWLPFDSLSKFGFSDLSETVEVLSKLGFLFISRNKRYFMLSQNGCKFLNGQGFDSDMGAKRPYENYPPLHRRLETASIMLTTLRAGIDTLRDDADALRDQPVFFPSLAFRSAASNSMSNSTSAGFGHWGGKAYILHYVSPESKGMFLTYELKLLQRLSSVFSEHLDVPEAMVFAGPSYMKVYEQITSKPLSKPGGARGVNSFADVHGRVDIPIHLLSCDGVGAMQLALMRQPGYNAKIAKAAYGVRWNPRDDQLPDADGVIDGKRTLLIVADMDIRRAARVIDDAKRLGRKEVALVAFEEQNEGLLMRIFPRDGFVSYLKINREVLDAAFGGDFSLHSFDGSIESGGRYG